MAPEARLLYQSMHNTVSGSCFAEKEAECQDFMKLISFLWRMLSDTVITTRIGHQTLDSSLFKAEFGEQQGKSAAAHRTL